jgi:alanine dehydrogenase
MCGVPNMPGAAPWTATQALNNATLPYVAKLARDGMDVLVTDTSLRQGLNVANGELVHPAVRDAFPDLADRKPEPLTAV